MYLNDWTMCVRERERKRKTAAQASPRGPSRLFADVFAKLMFDLDHMAAIVCQLGSHFIYMNREVVVSVTTAMNAVIFLIARGLTG